VAARWRRRALLRADGQPRRDAANLFTSVRAFYLDLAHWAAEDPTSWSAWVAPCPITPADLRRFAKAKHHQQARMHARIRTLAPVLPTLVASTHHPPTPPADLLAPAPHPPPAPAPPPPGAPPPPAPDRRRRPAGARARPPARRELHGRRPLLPPRGPPARPHPPPSRPGVGPTRP